MPSLISFLIIFYYFIRLRKRLLFDRINHHVILCILISDFLLIVTALPFALHYLSLGYVQTKKVCLFWIFWSYSLGAASLFLTVYTSIERYLLVFHKQCIVNHQLLLHYIPLGFAVSYAFGIYMYLVLLFPCTPSYQYDLMTFVCGGPCYMNAFVQSMYDTIVDTMLPPCVSLIFNILFIVRVIRLKRKVTPSILISNTLKKSRRMTLQLFAIRLMALINWMPWVVIILVQDFYDPSFGEQFINNVIYYVPYFTCSASPFLALIGLPEIREEFQKIMYRLTIARHTIGTTINNDKHEQ
ncbi:unnamed protein product [Rotaria socialis]|uniref:G-protein coupled receptors family 1 profile domain-containing protein n=2 Tax=Rotaria socialis TaxID=392032 RepID=A0A818QKK0_9BILA|nr:unnamed protein product [Rotaria socialis]